MVQERDPPRPLKNQANKEQEHQGRNMAILMRYEQIKHIKHVGKEFGLSIERTRRIIKREQSRAVSGAK